MNEGVIYKNGEFLFLDKNSPEDIINFRNLIAYKSDIKGDTYFYGYAFRKDIDSKIRTKFIEGIKNISFSIPEIERRNFIINAVSKFLAVVRVNRFDCLVYPRSERTIINWEIAKQISRAIRTSNCEVFELVKNLPQNVKFDYKRFELEFINAPTLNGKPRYTDKQRLEVYEHISKMMERIHSVSYFSIAKEVKPKYRPFIKDYLKFETHESEELFKSLDKPNILVIDDINTSFSTLEEIIRIIREVNLDSRIMIFTLIGKIF